MALSSSNLQEYFDRAVEESNDVKTLAFPASPTNPDMVAYFTVKEINLLARKALAYYVSQGLTPQLTDNEAVALCSAGTIEWVATFVALVRLGYTILSLSPRQPPENTKALVERSTCTTMIHDENPDLSCISETKKLHIASEPTLSSFSATEDPPKGSVPKLAFIWHSSGSTGVPKLFPMAQPETMARLKSYYDSTYRTGAFYVSSATYNSAGLTFTLSSFVKKQTSYFWHEPRPRTADGLSRFLRAARPDGLVLVPAALDLLASTPAGLEVMRSCRVVTGFGALTPQELGDRIVREGINFSVGLAMSEASTIMTSQLRPKGDKDWDYMVPFSWVKPYLWMKPIEENSQGAEQLYEAVMLAGNPNCPPSRANSSDPPGSFHAGDVFMKHPTLEDRWKFLGRKDDRFSLGTGAPVDALEYENVIRNALEDKIEEAVLFGQGRNALGVLIFMPEEAKTQKENVVEMVWKLIQGPINDKFTIGVDKQMIVVVFGGQLPRTDKGNIIRARVGLIYRQQIGEAYARIAS